MFFSYLAWSDPISTLKEIKNISKKNELIKNNVSGAKQKSALKKIKVDEMELISSAVHCYYYLNIDDMFEEADQNLRDNAIEILSNNSFGDSIIVEFYNDLSEMMFKKSLKELLSSGEDKLLLKAVSLDKTLIYSETIKKRIYKAQSENDYIFFNKLANKIKYKPININALYYETYIVLKNFWNIGLKKLTHEELYYFLMDDCGLIPPDYPENFEKFLQRNINPLFK